MTATAQLTIIYWRDIPAQVVVRAGRATAKRELPARFQAAIDAAAMAAGAKDAEAYLQAWRRGAPEPCAGEVEAAADAAAARLEAAYDGERLRRLAAGGGHEPKAAEHAIVFSPSGLRGRVAAGTTLLAAARRLGVDLDSVCGGRGICGRCEVEVLSGHLPKHGLASSADHVTAPSEGEERFAERRGARGPGRRLACQARVRGDLAIDVPPESQVHRQVVRKSASERPVAVDPVVTLHYVEVPPPDMHDPRSDAQRLREALAGQWGLSDLALPLPVLAELQGTLRQGGFKVTAAVRLGREVVALFPGLRERAAGIAVDLGSTTIAAHLCDLASGDVLAAAGAMNPQIRFGEDLMSRVSYAMLNPDGAGELCGAVRGALDGLVAGLAAEAGFARRDILEMTLVGNPVMHHLVLGLDPAELGRAPFALAEDAPLDVPARELGLAIAPGARVHLLPCIAGHVGSDAAAMVLAEAPQGRDGATLLVDVGTNAEIVLGTRERLLACSSPTGPAFEGAQIGSGQRAAPGAIERVRIDRDTFEPRFKVIGCDLWSDEPGFAEAVAGSGVTGLCGSGVIEAIGEMVLAGLVTADGTIDGRLAGRSPRLRAEGRTFSYLLHDGPSRIVVSQHDVRAIQLAKAALYAGAKLLMARLGVARVEGVRLAGAFGSHIDPLYALVLGLVPDCPPDRVRAVGNAAGHGARIALVNAAARAEIARLVRRIEKVETAIEAEFQTEFVAAMALPHASDSFPSLAEAVALPPRVAAEPARRRRPPLR